MFRLTRNESNAKRERHQDAYKYHRFTFTWRPRRAHKQTPDKNLTRRAWSRHHGDDASAQGASVQRLQRLRSLASRSVPNEMRRVLE